MLKTIALASLLLFTLSGFAQADTGLIIHAAEIGVAKFHRKGNQVHAYGAKNVWRHNILPDGADSHTPQVRLEDDQSYSIIFSTLEELLKTSMDLSKKTGKLITAISINGHGLPGGMWYPQDADDLKSLGCYSWQNAANAPDQENYDQYYGAISKDDIMQIRQMSQSSAPMNYGCTTGLSGWKNVVAKLPGLQAVFSDKAVIHFVSCVVGLGRAGDNFTKGIAELVLGQTHGSVETSTAFGLGDWSMPEGMGFWDYQTDAQLERDNSIYPVNRKDREIMQKGTIRVAQKTGSAWGTSLFANVDFMFVGETPTARGVSALIAPEAFAPDLSVEEAPLRVRVPGTQSYVEKLTRN